MDRVTLVCNLLISYLKSYKVRHVVISSGTRAIPFIKAIERDNYFTCYSVIDERNAAFYALGLSQQLNQPVGLTCTSGTAASNYLSGMTEAYFAHTPLVAITADRSMQVLNQLETQKVDQPAIFAPVTQKSVCLPVIKDEADFWYGKRLLDEVFLSMTSHGKGPIHINLPIEGSTNEITINRNDEERLAFSPVRLYQNSDFNKWQVALDELNKFDKVAIVIGQNINLDKDTAEAISRFCKSRQIPIIGDNLSNFRCDEMIFSQAPFKALNPKTFEPMLPELVISIGNNFQERIKDLFKAHKGKFKHWLVDESGMIRDWSRSLTSVFECSILQFFKYFNSRECRKTGGDYLEEWQRIYDAATLPQELEWSNFYLAQQFSQSIPENSLLHLAILNSTRLMQFFKLPESVKVTCNASSFGIDGCLPTLLGQAVVAKDKLSFILLGDLSFIYGMNALAIRGIGKNVRVLVSNNGGGAEFHIYPHLKNDDDVDVHIAAAHKYIAKEWAEATGFEYLSAHDKDELGIALEQFVSEAGDKPKLLEVFTDLHFDGEYCLDIYRYLEEKVAPVIHEIKLKQE